MRSKKVIKSIDTSNLPKNPNNSVDWNNSVGYKIPFIYDIINGEFNILDYNAETKMTLLEYKNKQNWFSNQAINKCNFNNFLKEFLDINYLFEIDQEIHNEQKDYLILNREIREKEKYNKQYDKYYIERKKYYLVKCLRCNNIQWLEEYQILNRGCGICSNRVIIPGFNDLATIRPDLIKYFENPEDAKTVSIYSHKEKDMNCPICHNCHKTMLVSTLSANGFSCDNCNDKISYGEKFIRCFLKQLNIDYIYQLTKRHFDWVENYRYDFYLKKYNTIIEVMGSQHSLKPFTVKRRGVITTIEEQQSIDKDKEILALNNGIDYYISINFIKYDIETIINNIKSSEIFNILNVSENNIDWNLCIKDAENSSIYKAVCDLWDDLGQYATITKVANDLNIGIEKTRRIIRNAQSNNLLKNQYFINRKGKTRNIEKIKEISYYWDNNKNCSINDMAEFFNMDRHTILKYLEEGNFLGFCNYNKEDSRRRANLKISKRKSKIVNVYNLKGEFIEQYDSVIITAEKLSEKYNKNFNNSKISAVCRRDKKQYKGFIFRYDEDDELN